MTSVQSMPLLNGANAAHEAGARHELSPSASPSSVHFALPRSTSPPGRPASSRIASNGVSPSLSPSGSLNAIAGPSRSQAQHAYTPSQLKQSTTPQAGKMRRTRSESTASALGGYVTTSEESEAEHEYDVDGEPSSNHRRDRRHLAPAGQPSLSLSGIAASSSSSSSGSLKHQPATLSHSRLPSSSSYHHPFTQPSATNRQRAHSSATPSLQPSMEFISREASRHPRVASFSSSGARPTGRLSAQPSQDRLSHNGSIPKPRRTREPSFEGTKRSSQHSRQSSKSRKLLDDARSSENEAAARSESRASRDLKGKGRAKDVSARSGFEAGLAGGSQQQRLDSEQLAALVSSIDINGALRIISDQKLSLPRSASTNQRASLQANKMAHQEPFLIRAPPPLMPRERADSTATQSTVNASPVPPRQRQVSVSLQRRRDSTNAPGARARAGSMVVAEEGGHVPFTHHARQASMSTDGEAEEVVVPAAKASEPPLKELVTEGVQSTVRRKGLGLLFNRKKKDKSEKAAPTTTSSPKPHKPVQELSEEQQREQRRRQEMEQERMELEAAQERTQATLSVLHQHPQAERSAYEARAHFQAYYNLLYEGIESREYVNPLLIIRWVHRRDQQAEARARWEAEERARTRNRPDGMFADVLHSSPVSIPFNGRRSHDGPRTSSEYSSRFRNGTFGTSLTTTTSHVSSARQTQERNRWKWTVDDARAFRDCKGEVDFFVPPQRDHEAESSRSLAAPAFSHANGSRDGQDSMKSASTGPDMSSLGDPNESRRFNAATSAYGDSDISRSVSRENPSRQPSKLVKLPPSRRESADEATDREGPGATRHRHGHHARAIVEHIKNAIPGRHDDGSADETDRGDRAGFSPRAFAHGLRPFRTSNEPIANGYTRDDEIDLTLVNGDRKASSTRAKVAMAIRNRAHVKPSQDRLAKPTVEHVDDVGSIKAIDHALDVGGDEPRDQPIATPADVPLLVPKVRVQDKELDAAYELRKERLQGAQRDLESLNGVSSILDTTSQQAGSQISHIKKLVEVTAGFKAEWPDFTALDLLARPTAVSHGAHPEASDTLAPLQRRASFLSGTDSDRSRRRGLSRRRSSLQAMSAQPMIASRAPPRRISLAPGEPIMLDPISRLAATAAYVSQQLRDFGRSTAETEAYQISIRTKMKAVEAKSAAKEIAARAAAQEIKNLDRQRATAAREASSQFSIRWTRVADVSMNLVARALIGKLVKVYSFFASFPCFFGFRRASDTGQWRWAPGRELFQMVCFLPVAAMFLFSAFYYYGDD